MISSLPKRRRRPKTWREFRATLDHQYLLPLYYANWLGEWVAFLLGKWSIFEVLEYVERLSILFAVIVYFAGRSDRLKQKHYQAWQVINTAQGKGGSGGRIEALRELNQDGVPLVGVDVSGAYLQNLSLVGADLRRGDFHAADLRGANFQRSNLEACDMQSANFRGANLGAANLDGADFRDADLNGARLSGANFSRADFDRADLRGADLASITGWRAIDSMRLANVHALQAAPDGFVAWALAHGAVDVADDAEWDRLLAATRPTASTAPRTYYAAHHGNMLREREISPHGR